MMDSQLENQFALMGARVQVTRNGVRPRPGTSRGEIMLDVRHDKKGEFFQIDLLPTALPVITMEVLDVCPENHHLLLMVRDRAGKHKFLCGHDERHWFVAAVPEKATGAGNVRTAMEALKPLAVREAQALKKLRTRDALRRKNEAFVRQGEWFFLPDPDLIVEEKLVRHHEPITRGNGSKPHVAEFCCRRGGETVYVCSYHPNGVSEEQYNRILRDRPESKSWRWQVMKRDSTVYVKGRVRHSDHKTIVLPCWHRVLMNTETESEAMKHVAFLD